MAPLSEKKHRLERTHLASAQGGLFAPALRISDFLRFREFRRTGSSNEILRYLPGGRDQAALGIFRLAHARASRLPVHAL